MMGSVVQDLVTIPNPESYTFHSISAFTCFFHLWEAMGKALELDPYSKIIAKDLPSHEGCFTHTSKVPKVKLRVPLQYMQGHRESGYSSTSINYTI